MVQYEMYFTNEYVEEILHDLTSIMNLDVDNKDIEAAMQERDKSSRNNLLVIEKNGNTVCVDCNDKDWIFPLVVKCQEKYADAVKESMLKWDNLIREEYGQELTDDIQNVYGKENTLLSSMEKYYGKGEKEESEGRKGV